MKAAAIGLLLMFIGSAFHFYGEFRAEQVRSEYNKLTTLITKQAADETAELQRRVNEITDTYHKDKGVAERRIQDLQARLSRVPVGDTVSTDAIFIGLFNEAINDKALPPSPNPVLIAPDTHPVAAYGLFAIGQYNECAIQLNALIEAVK